MSRIKIFFLGSICLLIVFVIFFTSVELVLFLSSLPNNRTLELNASSSIYEESEDVISAATTSSIIDILLLCGFMIQHSFFASPIKKVMSYFSLNCMDRLIFNFSTCIALQLIMHLWRPIPHYVFWNVDIIDNFAALVTFQAAQSVGWLIIYLMSMFHNPAEIIGVKQFYYHVTGRQDPVSLKSSNLQRLQKHIQHPSLLGFFIVFWVYPLMTLDRIFLAVIWTVYMFLAWEPTDQDYNYVVQQRNKKCMS